MTDSRRQTTVSLTVSPCLTKEIHSTSAGKQFETAFSLKDPAHQPSTSGHSVTWPTE